MSESKKLKGAIVGFGFIESKGHLPAYLKRKDVEIVAVADVCDARRQAAQEALPEARIYTHYDILLEQEDIDFIDIGTPPSFHAEIAKAALKKGVHVLCEKPLAVSLEEVTLMMNSAKEARRVLFPCHNYKHAPVVKAIREVIQSGSIGNISSVTLSTFRNTHAKGTPEWRTHWRREHRFSGGGIAMDHGSHTFYLTFDWLKGHPTAVSARMHNLSQAKYDTEDNFSATLTFPSGLANVHLTWTAGVRKVIYTIQGEKGAITVDDDEMQIATQKQTDEPDVAQGNVTWNVEKRSISSHWMDASHVEWFNSLFDQFLTAIHQQQYINLELVDAYYCIQLIEAAYQSSLEGGKERSLPSVPSELL